MIEYIGTVMNALCALGAASLWGSLFGMIWCVVYKKSKKGKIWVLTIVLFCAFFVFLIAWAVLRNFYPGIRAIL